MAGHLAIIGPHYFHAASRRASGLLMPTRSWTYARHLTALRHEPGFSHHASGYLDGTEFRVFDNALSPGDDWFASLIAHEGAHAAGADEDDAIAVQIQALREMGSARFVRYLLGHQANPRHQAAFDRDAEGRWA